MIVNETTFNSAKSGVRPFEGEVPGCGRGYDELMRGDNASTVVTKKSTKMVKLDTGLIVMGVIAIITLGWTTYTILERRKDRKKYEKLRRDGK